MEHLDIKTRAVISILLMIASVVFGVLLHKAGKPYNSFYFTLHKLLSLAFLIFVTITCTLAFRQSAFVLFHWLCVVFLGLSVLALLLSGAMMSLDKLNDMMLVVHRIASGICLISTVLLLYGIFRN